MSTSLPSGTWREPILVQFSRDIAGVARLTVVADPDELLTEQGIVDGIRQRGFEIVPFEDHVAFRYAYERRFREVWDNGNDTNLVVVLRAARSDISGLPFDLLRQAELDRRLLSFSLAELFPSLAPHVLSELDRGDLDAVPPSSFSSRRRWARTRHGIFFCETSFDSIRHKSKAMQTCSAPFCGATTAARWFPSRWTNG
jgi:hypothetical protein